MGVKAARAYGAQALPLRMARLVPCILELPGAFCCENAHMVSLRTLSGEQQYLAVSPTNYLADVRGLVCEAFQKPNFNVKLVNIATNEVSSKGHHQPFLNPDASIYHVLFQWVPMYEPGEHLALTDGTVDGEWPTVSSDSAAAGGYQTPYTTNVIGGCGTLALSWEEALSVCRFSGGPQEWTMAVCRLSGACESTLTGDQVKTIVQLVELGDALGLRTTVSPLRLLLRRHRLVPVKRRHSRKCKALKYNLSKAFAEWKKKKV